MTVEVTGTALEGTPAAVVSEDMKNVSITLEQITAAIINKLGVVEVDVADILQNYAGKTISITHDDEKNVLLFELVDAPAENA
jgi:predicted amino acid dehydrogenase